MIIVPYHDSEFLLEHILSMVFCVVVIHVNVIGICLLNITLYIINYFKRKCVFFFLGLRLCPFLEDHKEDILCGPVWLASGLDLSGHAGMLTLTSPKLVKGKVTYFTKA